MLSRIPQFDRHIDTTTPPVMLLQMLGALPIRTLDGSERTRLVASCT